MRLTIEGIAKGTGPKDSAVVVGWEFEENTHKRVERKRRNFQEVTLKCPIVSNIYSNSGKRHTSGERMRCKRDFNSTSEMRPCCNVDITCSLLKPESEGRAPSKLPCQEGKSYGSMSIKVSGK